MEFHPLAFLCNEVTNLPGDTWLFFRGRYHAILVTDLRSRNWRCELLAQDQLVSAEQDLWLDQEPSGNKSFHCYRQYHAGLTVEFCFQPQMPVSELEYSFVCRKIFDKFCDLLGWHLNNSNLPYPYFFSDFFPFSQQDLKTNLVSQKNFFFLSGRDGSGKKTFVLTFLAHHFGFFPGLSFFPEKQNLIKDLKNSLMVVQELALLEPQQQQEFLREMKDFQRVFVLSRYSIDALVDAGLVDDVLAEFCRNHLLPISSKNSEQVKKDIWLDFWHGFNREQIVEDVFGVSDLIVGDSIGSLRSSALETSRILSFLKVYIEKNNIREGVERFEVMAILSAIKTIGHSQNKVADFLGISRGSLQHKFRKYNILYSEI